MVPLAASTTTRVKQVVVYFLHLDSATSSTRNRRCFYWRVDGRSSRQRKVRQFCDYLLNTYILADSLWLPEMWADVQSVERKRTNNGSEAFRRHLNSSFYSAQPNLHIFTDNFLKIHANTYIHLRSLENPEKLCLIKGLIEIWFEWKRVCICGRRSMRPCKGYLLKNWQSRNWWHDSSQLRCTEMSWKGRKSDSPVQRQLCCTRDKTPWTWWMACLRRIS